MSERWLRFTPYGMAIAFASLPLFPSFITLTNVQFPGVSVVPLPLALLVLALMIVLAIWAIVAFFLPPRASTPLGRQAFAWWGVCMLSSILGLNPRDGVIFSSIMGLSAVWHIAIARYYERPNVARAIYWSFILSAGIAAAVAIAMVATRVPAAQYTIGHGRAIGTFVLPGELAGYLIVVIPLAFALARVAHSRALRLVSAVTLALAAVAMAMTFSRTGWVGLACAIAVFVAIRARGGRAGLIGGGAIVLAVLALVALLFNERHNPSENFTRIAIWQAALGAIDRFPLTGTGPFGFSHLYPFVRLPDGDATAFHAHSMYLTFLAELGVVGLSAFGWLIWSFARGVRQRLAQASPEAAILGTALAAGVAGTLVQGVIDTVSVVIFGLMFPILALALAALRAGTVDA